MVIEKTWKEFRNVGLLWWVNRMLHLFGWAIVVELDEKDMITKVYPAYCKFRGFDEKSEEEGFYKLTTHLKTHMSSLVKDIQIPVRLEDRVYHND